MHNRYRRNQSPVASFILSWIVVLGLVLGAILFSEHIIVASTSKEVTFIVKSTEVKRIADSDLYMIRIQYITGSDTNPTLGDFETVQVKDRWTMGNFRSADRYFELKDTEGTGKVWRGTIGGWRNGFMSWFPEIVNQELTGKMVE